MGKIEIILTVIIGVIGAMYLFLPHMTHIALGIDFGLPHEAHMMLGVVLIVLAILFYLIFERD